MEPEVFQPFNDESTSQTFTAPDGRSIGYALYGAETGSTVFYLHGFPGCRLSGVFFDGPGKELGARIIAVERPGIGISSPQPGRGALDHAEDVRLLAEHLGLETYGVMGVSGGGLYALACAYALPEEQLKSVSIVAGMGPFDIGIKGMNWSNWLTFQILLYVPWIMRWVQNKLVTVLRTIPSEKLLEISKGQKDKLLYRCFGPAAKDAVYLEDPNFIAMMLDFYQEHYKQGSDGFMEEGRVFTSDPGFKLGNIRASLPIQLWYGKQDTNVPLRMGEEIAARLNSSSEFIVKDETHLSLVMEHRYAALERLLERM